MKKKISKLLIFASAGALLHQGIMFANDEKATRSGDANAQLHGDLNSDDSLHAMQGQYRRASDLMGTDVLSQQNEKIGEVKDVMVDLHSGRAPFAVVSSGGFFGVGDRLMAVPTSVLSQSGEENLTLNVDKQRLQSAPSFERNSWPEMSDSSWSSEVYSYYGQEPMNGSLASSTGSTINEPAGADRSHSDLSRIPGHSSSISQAYGETTTGLSRDRTPRQGLGVEDLTKNEQKIRNPGGFAESDAFINRESAGAERTHSTSRMNRDGWTRSSSSGPEVKMGKVRRASELIGMEVDNANGERVGEIKDVVLDLQSGRVAYAVLAAGGYLGMGDRLFAVPPAVFTRSTDGDTLVFNTDKETLKAAPSFEKNDWSQADNQQFTTQVYRYYNQPLYWQSSGEMTEPSGSERQIQRDQNGQGGSSQNWEKGEHNSDQGAANQNPQINEPSGAAPERQTESQSEKESTPQTGQSQSSAAKETAELDAANPNQNANEPAGATTSTAPATSDDQASGDADRTLSQRLRTELKNDSQLSGKIENVQVSAANGRLTLRGNVATEQEKQAVEAMAKKLVGSPDKVDNQLRVTTETP